MGENRPESRLSEEEATEHARILAARGSPPEVIIAELVSRGVDRGAAVFIVSQRTPAVTRARARAGTREIVVGGLILLAGVGVGALSVLSVEQEGRTRFVFAGALLLGGLGQLMRGIYLMRDS